jgi:hypothetical protein
VLAKMKKAEYCPRLTRQRASDEEDGLKARLELGIYIIYRCWVTRRPRAAESGLIGLNWRLIRFGSAHKYGQNAKAGKQQLKVDSVNGRVLRVGYPLEDSPFNGR